MEPSSDVMPAVARALIVLEEVAGAGVELTFTELCERTDTPKATMHRLLATLEAKGYVARAGDGRYSAGLRCFELGSLWAQKLDLRAVAAPFLVRLNEDSRETVHLAIYEHGDVVYIDRLESPQEVIAKSHVGRRCPAISVATGRILLAYSATEEIDRVLGEPLPAFTERSVVEPRAAKAMLDEVRHQGFAVNRCSYRDEVSGIAAPVRDHTGRVAAAVGLCLPDHRFTDDRVPRLKELLLQAAADVSLALGGAPAREPAPGVPVTGASR